MIVSFVTIFDFFIQLFNFFVEFIFYIFYDQAFVQQDRGYAAAVALLIMLIIGLVTLVQFRVNRRNNQ